MASNSRRNSSKPIIGVTGNDKAFSPSWLCIRLAIWLAGGIARRISVRHEVDLTLLHGLVISGGDDIHPSLYQGQIANTVRYDQPRDELEKRHIEFAMMEHLPMLGICRGYQLINVMEGGNLFGDIKEMRKLTSNRGTIFPRKHVVVEEDSMLRTTMMASTFKVNSLHHQSIDQLGDSMVIVARDRDMIVQAIEHDNRHDQPILGVQWHPEYLFYIAKQRGIFKWLVDKARDNMSAIAD